MAIVRCHHGIARAWCSLCNGIAPLTTDPFGGMRQDDLPRYYKGRDKAEWRGIGHNYTPTHGTPLDDQIVLKRLQEDFLRCRGVKVKKVSIDASGPRVKASEYDRHKDRYWRFLVQPTKKSEG
jgi:hypothetical protein